MINVRPIVADELPAFASVATAPERRPDIEAYVQAMFVAGAMRPDWCYMAEAKGRPAGRIALWTLPSIGHPLSFVLWDAEGGPSAGREIARSLVDHVLMEALAAGSHELEYVIDDPPQAPQWQHGLRGRLAWLDGRFRLRRMTVRYELAPVVPAKPEMDDRGLVFQSVSEVGEAAFVEAIERVSFGSLDRRTVDERDRLGAAAEARQTWDGLKALDHRQEWWERAVDPAGRLVGVVMPCANPTSATIGYIGIAPEMRGRGHVDSLLARGTATLRTAGYGVIKADTDIANRPMAAAFERAGYRHFATRREYAITARRR